MRQKQIFGNYLINYLATRGPDVEPFVVGSLIQLLCLVTKFGWLDDDRFKEVMKFLSQPNSGLPSMLEHKIAISFKDLSVSKLSSFSKTDTANLLDEYASKIIEGFISSRFDSLQYENCGMYIMKIMEPILQLYVDGANLQCGADNFQLSLAEVKLVENCKKYLV
nr:hypothetical protein CFP56_71525 [Quercus suber]